MLEALLRKELFESSFETFDDFLGKNLKDVFLLLKLPRLERLERLELLNSGFLAAR